MSRHPAGCRCSVCLAGSELANSLDGLNEPGNDTKRRLPLVEPTASKTDRFIGCAWPWGREATDNEVGEPARFGSAFHAGMELTRKKKPVNYKQLGAKWNVDADRVKERVKASLPVLKTWLGGDNQWKLRFDCWNLRYEFAIAYNMQTGEAREAELPTEEAHEYEDRQDHEMLGTVDLGGAGDDAMVKRRQHNAYNAVLILDYKSGWDVSSPLESGQLLTLALGACRLHRVDRAYLALLHAPNGFAPTIYADSISAKNLDDHAAALKAADDRRGDGSMRPDYWCRWCQVYSQCPVNAKALAEIAPTALTTAESVGEAHYKLKQMEKRFSSLAATLDAEIRSWIRKNGDAVNPEGRDVGFVPRSFSNLSQASIIRALGEKKGRQEIERLRKLGCIEEGERDELRVK